MPRSFHENNGASERWWGAESRANYLADTEPYIPPALPNLITSAHLTRAAPHRRAIQVRHWNGKRTEEESRVIVEINILKSRPFLTASAVNNNGNAGGKRGDGATTERPAMVTSARGCEYTQRAYHTAVTEVTHAAQNSNTRLTCTGH